MNMLKVIRARTVHKDGSHVFGLYWYHFFLEKYTRFLVKPIFTHTHTHNHKTYL